MVNPLLLWHFQKTPYSRGKGFLEVRRIFQEAEEPQGPEQSEPEASSEAGSDEAVTSRTEQMLSDIDQFVQSGALSPEDAVRYRTLLEKAEEEEKQNLMQAIRNDINSGGLYLLTQGEDTQGRDRGFVLLLSRLDGALNGTEFDISDGGTSLAQQIIQNMKVENEAAQMAIENAVKTIITEKTNVSIPIKSIRFGPNSKVYLIPKGEGIKPIGPVIDTPAPALVHSETPQLAEQPAASASTPPPEGSEVPAAEAKKAAGEKLTAFLVGMGSEGMIFKVEILIQRANVTGAVKKELETKLKNVTPTPQRIRISPEGDRFQITVDNKGEWMDVESLQEFHNAATAFLEGQRYFEETVDGELKNSPLKKVFLQIVSKLFGIDLDELLKGSGLVSDLARGWLEIKASAPPQMSKALQQNLQDLIENDYNGEALPNNVKGEAQNDKSVTNMLADLGKRFSDPEKGGVITIVDPSSTQGVVKADDSKNAGETFGTLTLAVPTADQAAAIVLFAQRRSHDFGKTVQDKLKKLDLGPLNETVKDLTESTSTVNQYEKLQKEKEYPDNVIASFIKTSDGQYHVRITWHPDGKLEEDKEDKKDTKPGKKEPPKKSEGETKK